MKVLITNKQLELLRENAPKEFTCEKCDHSWVIEKKDNNPYLCHMCGYDSKKKKINHEELESFWKNHKEEEIEEKWSEKYKKSINCNNPKGFSQRAHCQGRKKRLKENTEDTDHGFKIDEIKVALKIMSDISETFGEGIPLEFKLHSYKIAISKFTHVPILNLFIDVNRKNGEPYQIEKDYIHPISMELLGILETLKLYSTIKMKPPYNFHFNKRSLENHKIV